MQLRLANSRSAVLASTCPLSDCLRHRVPKRHASVLRSATQQQQQQQQRTPHADAKQQPSAMPRLPQRPQRPAGKAPPSSNNSRDTPHNSSSSRDSPLKGIRRSPGIRPPTLPPSLPPEQQQKQAQERTFASLLAYSGLLGTVASAVSLVCPDVDLFGNFNLNPADITLGLQLLLPCCLLNLAIMAPDYSSWKVPQEPTIEAQQKMAEALLAWTANKQAAAQSAKDRSSSSSSSSGSSAATSDPPAVGATAVDAVNHASSSASSMGGDASASSQHGPVSDSQESGSSNSSSQGVGSSRGSSEAPGMTPPWLMEKPDPPLPLPLARLKDALLLAQGHYLSSTPRVALPWPMQAAVLLVNCLAAELLYRSVMLQVSGGWLTDRMLEAGAEDWVQAATAHLPVLATPHMTGQLAAVALLSGVWGVAVMRQVARMSRRPVRALASQGKTASGQLLRDMQRLAAPDRGQRQQGQHTQQQEGQGAASGTDTGSTLQQDCSSSASSGGQPGDQQEKPVQDGPSASNSQPSSRTAAELAAAAAAAAAEDTNLAGSSGSRSKQRDKKALRGLLLPNALGALALSQVLTGVRDLSQAAGLGLAFALTGNLAAPLVASVVTEGLLAVLQRRAQERSRKRSIAFAQHFASFTRVFRDAQRQQQLQQESTQDKAGTDSAQQQHAAPGASPSDAGLQSQALIPGVNAASSSHADCSDDADALDAAVAAAVDCHPAALHVAAAAAASQDAGEAGAAGAAPTRVEHTISVLDQLLGEQLSERAAAAGPPGK